VQSCAQIDAVELQHTKEIKKKLELVLEQVKIETKYEKYRMDRLEKGVVVSYDKVPKSAQIEDPMTMQKIDQIVQTID
jgi:hypothetical protein